MASLYNSHLFLSEYYENLRAAVQIEQVSSTKASFLYRRGPVSGRYLLPVVFAVGMLPLIHAIEAR